MKRITHGLGPMLALCLISAPGSVQAASPVADAVTAGRVQELSLLLSSLALRCNVIGINQQPDYDRFQARQKSSLTRADLTLRDYFGVRSKADLHADIDRFYIRVLNFYGTGRTDRQSCETNGEVLNLLAQGDESGTLLAAIAEIMVPDPMITAPGLPAH